MFGTGIRAGLLHQRASALSWEPRRALSPLRVVNFLLLADASGYYPDGGVSAQAGTAPPSFPAAEAAGY
jgi:hypothetical protein